MERACSYSVPDLMEGKPFLHKLRQIEMETEEDFSEDKIANDEESSKIESKESSMLVDSIITISNPINSSFKKSSSVHVGENGSKEDGE